MPPYGIDWSFLHCSSVNALPLSTTTNVQYIIINRQSVTIKDNITNFILPLCQRTVLYNHCNTNCIFNTTLFRQLYRQQRFTWPIQFLTLSADVAATMQGWVPSKRPTATLLGRILWLRLNVNTAFIGVAWDMLVFCRGHDFRQENSSSSGYSALWLLGFR